MIDADAGRGGAWVWYKCSLSGEEREEEVRLSGGRAGGKTLSSVGSEHIICGSKGTCTSAGNVLREKQKNDNVGKMGLAIWIVVVELRDLGLE